LLPTRPAKDFHLQSSAHARHTSLRHTQHPAPSNESNPAENHLSFAGNCSDNRDQLSFCITQVSAVGQDLLASHWP
jgi:hypothetical protein